MSEWFDQPGPGATRPGLRFSCTACGACCTGPPGFVRFTDDEARAMAQVLGIGVEAFYTKYTHQTPAGSSLREARTEHGLDCVFLDRDSEPGKALCAVYDTRPMQCRTWPFWESNLESRRHWDEAARNCPGMNTGGLRSPRQIRIERAKVRM